MDQPCIIDLFAGAGGLSLGAAKAGFYVAGAVENDPTALATHLRNFPDTAHIAADVRTLSGADLLDRSKIARGQLDGLIGGPPCQGFSEIGKRDPGDRRNELIREFMRLVAETRPKFFLMENVPGIVSDANIELLESAADLVPADYEWLPPLPITACDFGAPTTRTRYFFVGYDPARMKTIELEQLIARATTDTAMVAHALSGLPEHPELGDSQRLMWTRIGRLESPSYAAEVQGRPPAGTGDQDIVERFFAKNEVCGFVGTEHTKEVKARFRKLGYGERDAVSKAVRLDPKGYCPTLRAGTGADRGSYQAVRPIHPSAPRVITPREAARLQGFPDWFALPPTKWHSFRQIGNSVSPIISAQLLRACYRNVC